MKENSSLRPKDLQQVLDFLIEERELRWPSEGYSSDIEISLGTQYLDPVASPFDSECRGNDQSQGHYGVDVESHAGSSRSTSELDRTANFTSLLDSDDDIYSYNYC
ncbi:putative multidrug resistance protein fnx1 [Erysiphe neolycopersici]|uniref:Putative multidrug resistance protein fnx1 n=1 Tax=Erysiphe neolycopersici TaxID=212602 RepID=A0A420HHK0_9PEZI|nr:putative multidrug resistance protein fnx1 [Erysiphe neolycopersici]